jgi:hypothetical protein
MCTPPAKMAAKEYAELQGNPPDRGSLRGAWVCGFAPRVRK